MSALTELVEDLAVMCDQMGVRLRKFLADQAVEADRSAVLPLGDRVVSAARRLHASIGPRQIEALRLIAAAHPEGVGTGTLMREMHIDQPNVYLTLQSMVKGNHRFLRKDETSTPHLYYLSDEILRQAGDNGPRSD